MKRLDPHAQSILDSYLRRLQLALATCPSVDPWDVEGDVREHIECELSNSAEPVTAPAISRVLERLGSPRQWIPDEDLSDWQRMTLRLRSGPEDWRLAYFSFFLLLAAAVVDSFTVAGVAASFLVARAAISTMLLQGDSDGAQRWFTYPALVVVYVPLCAVLLLWPAVALRLFADLVVEVEGIAWRVGPALTSIAHRVYDVRLTGFDPSITGKALVGVAHFFVAAVAGWWIVLGAIGLRAPALPRLLLRPFLDGRSRAVSIGLVIAGLAGLIAALVLIVIKLRGGVFLL